METTFTIVSVLEILKLFLGITLGILVLIMNRKRNNNAFFLGLFILVYGLQSVPEVLKVLPYFSENIYVQELVTEFLLLKMPLLYIYVRKVAILPKKNISYALLIPGIVEVFLSLVLLFFPKEIQQQVAESLEYDLYLILSLLFALLIAIFIVRLANRHLKELKNQYSSLEYKTLKWVKHYILSFFAFISLVPIVVVFLDDFYIDVIGVSGGIIFVYWAALRGILQDNAPMLYKETGGAEETKKNTIVNTSSKNEEMANDIIIKQIVEKLKKVVTEKELYKKNDLTIIDVAEAIEIHPSKLSKIINTGLNQNFNNFINYYRIEHSKQLLQENDSNRMSIEGISLEVGFKSRSSFYQAFKKHTTITPSAYLKTIS